MHKIMTFAAALAALASTLSTPSLADDKAMIDANTERALTWLRSEGGDMTRLLEQSAGVLVFPDLVEMGFGVGGEFGEGALLVDGKTVGYYATAGKTFGMGPEADYKAEVIFFMTEESLEQFRRTRSWKVGQHAQVPVFSGGGGGDHSDGIVGLIFSEDGVARGLRLDGDRITRIVR